HAMCFGIKNAPLVFHKLMKPVMQYIRTSLQIRCLSYSDDLVFINNSKEDLQQQIPKILEILTDLRWKISREKSILTPQQEIEFLGWKVDLKNNQLSMTRERRAETLCLLGKWRRIIEKNQIVRIKWVASLIGKLNFLRTQFRRGVEVGTAECGSASKLQERSIGGGKQFSTTTQLTQRFKNQKRS
ncbi:MAG: hypothetical protein EZS28_055348, partial [Streblomastix strix]